MKRLSIIVLFCILGCGQSNISSENKTVTHNQSDSILKPDTVNITTGKLIEKAPQLSEDSLPPFPVIWSSLKAIPTHWTKLERDEKGYLVYDPCDGNTPTIIIDKDNITIYSQIDQPDVLSIDKFTRLKDNKAFYLRATNHNLSAEILSTIVDAKRKLVLWQIDLSWNGNQSAKSQMRMVMSPEPYAKTFRVLKHPCKNVKEAEKAFLPVEY